MGFTFQKAVKTDSKLRLALIAPSGGGKTYTSLTVAKALSKRRIAVIDTERGSARKYADLFDFDVLELTTHSPDDYRRAIAAASDGTWDVLVIDSLSHAWMGKDGALEQVDKQTALTKSGNSFAAWRHVTPMHNKLVDALVAAPLHLIVTMRAKTEWVQEKGENGKTVIRKVGMAAVQRDGLEYEFDVVGDMEPDRNTLIISKTRCPDLHGAIIEKPGAELAESLQRWLQGAVTPFGRAAAAVMAAMTTAQLEAAAELAKGLDKPDRDRLKPIYAARRDRVQQLEAAASEDDAETDDELVPRDLFAVDTDEELPEPQKGAFCYVHQRENGRHWLVADVESMVWRTVTKKAEKEQLQKAATCLAKARSWDLTDANEIGARLLKEG